MYISSQDPRFTVLPPTSICRSEFALMHSMRKTGCFCFLKLSTLSNVRDRMYIYTGPTSEKRWVHVFVKHDKYPYHQTGADVHSAEQTLRSFDIQTLMATLTWLLVMMHLSICFTSVYFLCMVHLTLFSPIGSLCFYVWIAQWALNSSTFICRFRSNTCNQLVCCKPSCGPMPKTRSPFSQKWCWTIAIPQQNL